MVSEVMPIVFLFGAEAWRATLGGGQIKVEGACKPIGGERLQQTIEDG